MKFLREYSVAIFTVAVLVIIVLGSGPRGWRMARLKSVVSIEAGTLQAKNEVSERCDEGLYATKKGLFRCGRYVLNPQTTIFVLTYYGETFQHEGALVHAQWEDGSSGAFKLF